MTDEEIRDEIASIPPLLGVTEVSRLIGWDRRKVSVYYERGKFPPAATVVGKRPFWSKNQIEQWLVLKNEEKAVEIKK